MSSYSWPGVETGEVPTYPTYSALPATAADGSLAVVLDTHILYVFDAATGAWDAIGGEGTVTYISVKAFGATGNGSTDDTTAIQNALNFASTTGGTIYAPAGTYIISASLTIYNNTRFLGDGSGATILKRKAGSNINPQTPSFKGFLNALDATGIVVQGVKFDGLGSWTATPFANPYGGGNSVGFTNNEIGIFFKKASGGVGVKNVRIENCEFTGLGHGVYIDGGAQADSQNIWVESCYAHNMGTKAIEVYNVSICSIVDNEISGVFGNLTDPGDTSTASSKFADGIYLGASSNVDVTDNEVYSFIRAGIVVQPNGIVESSTRLNISDNIVQYGHDSKGTEYNTGIYLGDGFINLPNNVSDNVIYDIGSGGRVIGYGIVAEHCTVSGGSINDCVTAGLRIVGDAVDIVGVNSSSNAYGLVAAGMLAGTNATVKGCDFRSNTICGLQFSLCHGDIEILSNTIEDNGGGTTSRAASGSCSGLNIERYYNDQKVIVKGNTFISSANAAATTGQLYGILGVTGGDFTYTTRYIENNTFLFTGTLAAYPGSLHAVPESFAVDNTSVVLNYEIVNSYGNTNSKAPFNTQEINFGYSDGFPRYLGLANAAPGSGSFQVGDNYQNDTLSSTGAYLFVNTVTGSPGTWQTWSYVTSGTQTITGAKTLSSATTINNTLTVDVTGGSSGTGITLKTTDTVNPRLSILRNTTNGWLFDVSSNIASAQSLASGYAFFDSTGGNTLLRILDNGNSTFFGTIAASNLSGTNTGDVTLGTANGLSLAGQVLSLAASSTSTTGALTSTDWNTFNGKQAAGNYITALTGDVTASGPGSVASTVAKIAGTTVSGTTGSTNVVFSASPTLTGTALCAALTTSGRIGLGNTADTGSLCSADNSQSQAIMSGTTQGGFVSWVRGTSAATVNVYGFKSVPTTAASAITTTDFDAYLAGALVKGSTSTVTRATTFRSVGISTTGGTGNALLTDNNSYSGNFGIHLATSNANNLGTGKTTVQTFQVSALTTAGPVTVDSSGNFSSAATITSAQIPFVGCGYTSSSTAMLNSGDTVIVFPTVDYDPSSAYNTSTGVFTVPAGAGGRYLYQLTFFFASATWTAGNFMRMKFRVNGTAKKDAAISIPAMVTNQAGGSCSVVLNVNATDTLDVLGFQNAAASIALSGDIFTNMSITRL